jgi:hypothetical protein
MEAGNKGAEGKNDFALNIRLPHEQKPNPYIDEKERLINFKYFFTRKLTFVKETDATALFPGGFGTNDEGFEMLTLIQTGKSRPRPVVLMEPEGSSYWSDWKRFIERHLVKTGFVDKEDLNIFSLERSVDGAIKYIDDFYRVYHSLRYVGRETVIRLNKQLSDESLRLINSQYKDILSSGTILPGKAKKEEIEKNEYPFLPRLIMNFNKHSYGRLCKLIHLINRQ